MYLSCYQILSWYELILFSDVLADMNLSYYQMLNWYELILLSDD
jgi:hypothetical protein